MASNIRRRNLWWQLPAILVPALALVLGPGAVLGVALASAHAGVPVLGDSLHPIQANALAGSAASNSGATGKADPARPYDCVIDRDYVYTTTTGSAIFPGTIDIGNHGDDVTTTVALPFSFSLYGATFSAVTISSNGNTQLSGSSTAENNACLPASAMNNLLAPYWDDLRTDCVDCGVFTATTGSAPTRTSVIEIGR